jgi:hypothetical protein
MTIAEPVTFKSIPATRGWTVIRDGRAVAHYPNQSIAEREMARLARAVAKKGGQARAILHKRDGSVASERTYTKLTTPWLGPGAR